MKLTSFRSSVLQILLVVGLFQCGCTDEKGTEPKVQSSYIPFPPKPIRELTGTEKKILEQQDFVKIEPGDFLMGSPDSEVGRHLNEQSHKVRITRPYYIAVSEVTIAQWNMVQPKILWKDEPFFLSEEIQKIIMRMKKEFPGEKSRELILNSNERVYTVQIIEKIVPVLQKILQTQKTSLKKKQKITWSIGDIEFSLKEMEALIIEKKNLPVTDVSYPQANSFCWRKTEYAWKTGKIPKEMVFRLPTEAEWEYACRAGSSGVCGLEEGDKLSGMNANINGGKKEFIIGPENYLLNKEHLVPVVVTKRKYPANALGIHDMHGNVYEWCYDYYDDYPEDSLTIDPIGPIRGKERVLRGGSFIRTAYDARSAARHSVEPSWRGSEIGFRLVLGYQL